MNKYEFVDTKTGNVISHSIKIPSTYKLLCLINDLDKSKRDDLKGYAREIVLINRSDFRLSQKDDERVYEIIKEHCEKDADNDVVSKKYAEIRSIHVLKIVTDDTSFLKACVLACGLAFDIASSDISQILDTLEADKSLSLDKVILVGLSMIDRTNLLTSEVNKSVSDFSRFLG